MLLPATNLCGLKLCRMRILPAIILLAMFQYAPIATEAQDATSFDHIAFAVKDLKRSATFYQQLLGLQAIDDPFKDGKHLWLKVSERGSLHLIEGNRIPVSIKESHLCFSVPSVEALMEKLKQAAIPFENWPGEPNTFNVRADGVKQIYLRDPDGYWLEVNDASSRPGSR